MIRGLVAFACVSVLFPLADLVARTLVRALASVGSPRWRHAVMLRWQNAMVGAVFGILRWVGGARVRVEARIEGGPGHLIVGNHQSLLDIPAVMRALRGDWPLFVTRERYRRRIPLVSIMLRMYGHVFVRQGSRDPAQLERLREFARNAQHPVVVFPEGHRTRTGELLPWKKAGLRAILQTRPWTVHLLVIDGLWRSVSIGEFVRELPHVRARVVEAGTFRFDPGRDDADAFIERLRRTQAEALERLRRDASPTPEVHVAG